MDDFGVKSLVKVTDEKLMRRVRIQNASGAQSVMDDFGVKSIDKVKGKR